MRNRSSRIIRGAVGIGLVLALGALPVTRTHAEIEGIADPQKRGIILMWWPKVTPPDEWVHLPSVSYENYINLFVLKGRTFNDSPAVMYARAIYHEEGNTEQALETDIRKDHEGFRERFPDSSVEEVEAVKTGDGTGLKTFSFTPQGKGHWELVAYGREPQYVLMFCISAQNKETLEQYRPAFLAMVRSYTSRDDDPP